jgi:hypothetical protein
VQEDVAAEEEALGVVAKVAKVVATAGIQAADDVADAGQVNILS